jgi:hypothetical protein
MGPEGLPSCSEEPAIESYPESDESFPHTPLCSIKSTLMLSSHLLLDLARGFFPSDFPEKTF